MSQQILVLDCHVHTLTVVRSLSRAGYQVTLGVTVDDVKRGYVHVSRHVKSTWLHPDIVDDAARFEVALLEFLSGNPQVRTIFPVGENSVRRLTSCRADIPRDVLIAMPENVIVETCLHKPSAYRFAEKCGIPTPATRIVRSAEDLGAAINELGYPSIVKAPDSSALLSDKKCVFVRGAEDLAALVDNWPKCKRDFIVQNEIAGTRFNCDVVAAQGRIRHYFQSEIFRTDQLDYAGNSVFDRSIPPRPLHREYCDRFVGKLNYTGVALIQFLCDARSEKCYFLEANPRLGSTIGLAVHCGIDLPAETVRVYIGDSVSSDGPYPVGRSQNWLHGDLLGLRKARLDGQIGPMKSIAWLFRALLDFLRADCHTTFAWNDPLPTLKLYWELLARTVIKDRRRVVKSHRNGR